MRIKSNHVSAFAAPRTHWHTYPFSAINIFFSLIDQPSHGWGLGIIFTPRRAIWAAQLTPLRPRSRLINNETNLLICFARCAGSAGTSLGGLFVRRASRSTVEHARVQEFAGANPRNAPVPRVEPGFYFWKLQSE